MKNTLIKAWGIVLTVAILAGLLITGAIPVSAGYSPATTQIATPTAQFTTATIDFMSAAADGKTIFVYSNTTKVLYKSVDGGMTWAATSAPATTSNGLDSLTLTGLTVSGGYATDNVVVATTGTNVYVSSNGGTSFFTPTQYPAIPPSGTIQSVAVTSVNGAYTILVGTTASMYVYSQNTGAWTAQTLTGSVLAVAFSPNYASDSEILAVTQSAGNVAALNFKISTGAWNNLGSTPFTAPTLAAAAPITKAVMAFGSDYYPYGGGTVLIGISGIAPTPANGVGGDDLYSATIASTGGNWSDKEVGGTNTATSINSLAVNGTLAAGKIYVGKSTGAVSKVTGLGNAWVAATKSPYGANALVAIMGTKIVAGTNGAGGAFYLSTDDAVTFNGVSLIMVSNTATLKVVNFSAMDAETIFLMVLDGANDLVFRTTDGGMTWTEVFFGTNLFGVYQSPAYFSDNTVYIPSNSPVQVWVSANGGNSFTAQFVPGPGTNITAFLPVDGTKYYLGYAGAVSRSGIFNPLVSTGITGTVMSIFRGPAGEIFVGTDVGTVYMSTNDAVSFTQVGGGVGLGNVSIHTDPNYAANKKIYAVTTGASGGFVFTVGTSLTWAPLGLSPFASTVLEIDPSGEFYYNNVSANASLGRTLSTIVNDPIDPSQPASGASAPWLVGADFNWVKLIDTTAVNTLIVLAGNVNPPTQAALYSPAYPYSFRLVKILDNFVAAPAITSPAAAAQTTTTPTFTWTAVEGATSYDIAFGPDATGVAPTVSATSVGTSYTVAVALNAGASYNVRVRVSLASPLVSYWSAPMAFSVKLTQNPNLPPSPQAPLPGAILNATSPTFQWQASGLAATYDIVLSDKSDTDSSGKFTSIIDSATGLNNNLYTTSKTLVPGAYYWEVRAVNGSVVGDWIQSSFSVAAPPTTTTPGGGTTTVTIPPITVPTPTVNVPPANVTVSVPTPNVTVNPEPTATPAWVWVMIVIGAVLVIAVIVLIVRTRRV